MINNPLFFLLLGLLVTWVGSYFYSIQFNRRRLRGLAQWLQSALPLLGIKWNSRWQGADRLDVLVSEGRDNVREAAIVMALQSRQLFKALLSTLRHGRDSLTLLASLNHAPPRSGEYEIFEASGPLPRYVAAEANGVQPWEVLDYPRSKVYRVAARSQSGREAAFRVLTLLLDDGLEVRRISLRAGAPHIMVVVNLGKLPQIEAAAFLRVIKNMSDEAAPPTRAKPSGTGRKSKDIGSKLPSTSNPRYSNNGHQDHHQQN